MVRAMNAVKTGGGSTQSAQRDRKKLTTVHIPSDKGSDTPICSGCDAAIGKNVKALQCDLCASHHSWMCIDCLDIRPTVYDALADGQGKELRWFCKSCDVSVIKNSEKLDEIANVLKLLTAKSESIEAALMDKADKTILDVFSDKLTSMEISVDKLTHCNVDLKKELTKSVEGIKYSNAKLGDSFQCKIEEKVGSLETSVNQQNRLDTHFIHDCVQGAVQVQLQEDLAEQEDIKRRKNNVVLHGLREPAGDDADSRKAADDDQIMELFHELGCDDVSVDSVVRLGKRTEDEQAKPRPLLLRMASEEQKDKVLRQSKNLRMKYATEPNRLFVHQDLTPKQREVRRRLVSELKLRQSNGESNLTIVNGKIVQRKNRNAQVVMQGSPR